MLAGDVVLEISGLDFHSVSSRFQQVARRSLACKTTPWTMASSLEAANHPNTLTLNRVRQVKSLSALAWSRRTKT